MESTPQGILILEDYLNPEKLSSITDYANFQVGNLALIGRTTEESSDVNLDRDSSFEAERIELHDIRGVAEEICNDIFGNRIPAYYGNEIEWYEFPHILRYRRGGQYIPHSDSESWDKVTQKWVKGIDRDYSAIVYLNDQFTGGKLHFPDLGYYIKPKPGMLVCFPSDHRFRHAAEPTLSGKRYAMVTWASQRGIQKLINNPPMEVVRL